MVNETMQETQCEQVTETAAQEIADTSTDCTETVNTGNACTETVVTGADCTETANARIDCTELAVQETQEVEAKACTDMAAVPEKTPLQLLAEEKMKELQALNPGFKLDFMHVFTRLKINAKGQFTYMLSGEEFNLTDIVDVRLLVGEYMFQLWGDDASDQKGELICYSNDNITNCEGGLCAECPHDVDACKLRFAMVVNLLSEGEDPEELYNINLSTTAAYAFADYVKYMKKVFKNGVGTCVTQMRTESKKSPSDEKVQYNAVIFKYSPNQEKLDTVAK